MKRLTAMLLLLLLLCGCGAPADPLSEAMEQATAYLLETVPEPTVNTVGGEWAVLGLILSEAEVPDGYYETYYENLTAYTLDCEGRLDSRKYTEYSRVTLALTAMGKDPTDVAGYDLLRPLGDFDKTVWQGVNSPIWALIALDSGKYDVPENPEAETQASRELYLNHILEKQLPDGGWTLAGDVADPDMTAMALQALSNYTDRPAVQTAVDAGLLWLSEKQDDQGGYGDNSESVSQTIVALTSLGISLEDSRFVKNENTLLDRLLTFQLENGSFAHALDGTGENLMSTEQAFYAMTAAWRARQGKRFLWSMK